MEPMLEEQFINIGFSWFIALPIAAIAIGSSSKPVTKTSTWLLGVLPAALAGLLSRALG